MRLLAIHTPLFPLLIALYAFSLAGTASSGKVYPFEAYFKHFTSQDGLPSSIVHEVFQDSEKNIWFCTENGISRYNGQDFKNYDVSEGLCFNATIDGHEAKDGRIWFYTAIAKVFVYDPKTDQIQCPEYNDTLHQNFDSRLISKIFHIEDTLVIVARNNAAAYLVFDSVNHELLFFSLRSAQQNTGFLRISNEDAMLLGKNYTVAQEIARWSGLELSEKSFAEVIVRPVITRIPGGYAFALGKLLFQLNEDFSIKRSLRNEEDFIGSIHYDRVSGTIILGTHHGGAIEVDLTSLTKIRTILDGRTVTCYFRDHEGGVWISTYENGVFYYPGATLQCLSASPNSSGLHPVVISRINDTMVLVGTKQGDLLSYSSNHQTEMQLLQSFERELAFAVLNPQRKSEAIVMHPHGHKLDLKTMKVEPSNNFHKCMYIDRSNRPMTIDLDEDELSVLDSVGSVVKVLHKRWLHGHLRTMFQVDECNAYLVSRAALFHFNICSEELVKIETESFGTSAVRVTNILTQHLDTLLVATDAQGIYVIKGSTILQHITQQQGLISNDCRALEKAEDGSWWVGSDAGLQRFEWQNGRLESKVQLRPETGYPFRLVKCLAVMKDHLIVGTESNIYRVTPPESEDALLLCQQIELQSVTCRRRQVLKDEKGTYTLPANFGTVTFNLARVCFRNSGQHLKRYRIPELDTAWISLAENHLLLTGISAGNYHLELQTMTLSGQWSEQKEATTFSVLSPFYLRWWFIALMSFLVISTLGSVLYQRTLMLAKNSKLQLGVLEANNRALGAQLNPHFLYNVLNTVGGSIARNNVSESLDVIGKFSRLMRTVFENSRSDLISLNKEMKAIHSYMELEQIRLDQKLNFTMVNALDDTEESSFFIPPLLLQPIIENAIWHGVANTDDLGRIELEFGKEKKLLQIHIKNNGKGIDRNSEDLFRKNQKSSLKVIDERLALLSRIYGQSAHLRFNSSPAGGWTTIATLTLPIITEHHGTS